MKNGLIIYISYMRASQVQAEVVLSQRKAYFRVPPVEKLVPGSVAGYIRIHGLYREAFDD